MGGFKRYGILTEDFIMIKGTVQGPIKRNITLRKSLVPQTLKRFTQPVNIKFIDTASKVGKGRFQTSTEKSGHFERNRENSEIRPQNEYFVENFHQRRK